MSYCKRVFSKQSRNVAKDRTALSIYAANICSSWSSAIALIPGLLAAKANTGVGRVTAGPTPAQYPEQQRESHPADRNTLQALGVEVQVKTGWVKEHSGNGLCASWPLSVLFFFLLFFHDSYFCLLFLESDLNIQAPNKRNQIKSPHSNDETIRANQEGGEDFFSPNVTWVTSSNRDDLMPHLHLLAFTIGRS